MSLWVRPVASGTDRRTSVLKSAQLKRMHSSITHDAHQYYVEMFCFSFQQFTTERFFIDALLLVDCCCSCLLLL